MRHRAVGGPQLAENPPYDNSAEYGFKQPRAIKAELRSLYEMFITMNQLPKDEGVRRCSYTQMAQITMKSHRG